MSLFFPFIATGDSTVLFSASVIVIYFSENLVPNIIREYRHHVLYHLYTNDLVY